MTAALIIAAGKTARRDQFNPQKEVGTVPAIQRIALVFQRAGIERVVVAYSDGGDKTEKLAGHMGLVFLRCPEGSEMLDNVKAGLGYLQDKCTGVLISHVDVPLFSVKTVHALMAAEGAVCVPSFHGRGGHPMLLRAEHFPAILSYTGDGGLAGAVRASGLRRHMVAVEDEGVLADIEDETACAHLIKKHDLSEPHPDFTFRLMKERVFYGPGAHQLLQLTEETGSLMDACRHMGISYTKGRKIISTLEEQMGCPMIESQQGGRTGGSSFVTGDAKKLMSNYDHFCAEAKQLLNELFEKYFSP